MNKMNTNTTTKTSNLQSSLNVYRAAACTLNDQLMRVQARINDLEHQNQLYLQTIRKKDQELATFRQQLCFTESCFQALLGHLEELTKKDDQVHQERSHFRVVDMDKASFSGDTQSPSPQTSSTPTPGPSRIITIGDPSPVITFDDVFTSDDVFIRPTPGIGRVFTIGDKAPAVTATATRSSPGRARIITVGDKSPVVMAQATATRPTPGSRPEEFQAKRRKNSSSVSWYLKKRSKTTQM